MMPTAIVEEDRLVALDVTRTSRLGSQRDQRHPSVGVVQALESFIFWGLTLMVCSAPWLYGGQSPYVLGWLTVGLAALGLLWSVKSALEGAIRLLWSPIHTLFGAFVILGVVQGLPLPMAIRSIGTETDLLGVGSASWKWITMNPQATGEIVWRLIVLFAYFLLVTAVMRTRRQVRALMWVLIISGCAISVVALMNRVAPEKALLWRFDGESLAFGPFANRAHFAAFIELVMPFAVAFLAASPRRRDFWPIVGVAVLLMSVAVVLSASRAGVVLIVLEVLVLIVLSGRKRVRWLVIGLGLALGVAGVVWLTTEGAFERILRRFTEETLVFSPGSPTTRLTIWSTTLTMIADQPLLGVGLGAFDVAYPRYDAGNGLQLTAHAHNEFLHVVSETGVVGGLMSLLFLLSGVRIGRRALRQADAELRPPAFAAAVGCGALAIHSLVDVPLHVMANALAFLSAMAVLLVIERMSAVSRPSLSASAPNHPAALARQEVSHADL